MKLTKKILVRMYDFLFFILVLGKEGAEFDPPSLVISQSDFISNVANGIYIYLSSRKLGNVHIQSTVIRDSAGTGLVIHNSDVKNLNLLNCSLLGNKMGIYLYYFSGKAIIENSTISNSTSSAVSVNSGGLKTVHLIDSIIVNSKGAGIVVYDRYPLITLLVSRTLFVWNEREAFIAHSAMSIALFRNCTFLQNSGPVLYFGKYARPNILVFEGNVLNENTGSAVLFMSSYYLDEIHIRRNYFLSNVCHEKGILHFGGSTRTKKLIIEDNRFLRNNGRSVYVKGSTSAPVTIIRNIFKDNNCSNVGVVDIRRMENEVTIADNIFMTNKGLSMVLLQCVYRISVGIIKHNLTFVNNSLVNNTEIPRKSFGCQVNISGLLDNKTITMNENKFNSARFSKELCVNVLASSHTSILHAPFNFWGYDDEVEVRKRIWDAGSNHELVLVDVSPFVTSIGTVTQRENKTTDDRKTFKELGGRISSHVRLQSNHSSYMIVSDVVVLPEASLTVEPGVHIKFAPSVSMLILGSLFVLGTADRPVKLSLLTKTPKHSPIPVRLFGGRYPWIGRPEVAHRGTWEPVCLEDSGSWGLKNGKIICKHLGYESLLSVRHILRDTPLDNTTWWPFNINCIGNETDVNECPLVFDNRRCNSSQHVTLVCGGGRPWGNLRFQREFNSNTNQTSSILEHVHIEHCGHRHGQEVAAIEAIQYVPKINFVNVLNCTFGGLKVIFPEGEVYVNNSSFVNAEGNGTELLGAKRNVTLRGVKSINNKHGVTFNDPDENNLKGLSYGQIMLCARGSLVNFTKDELFLYFKVPHIAEANPTISCQKVIRVESDRALSFKLLDLQKHQVVRIYDPDGREIIRSYDREERQRLQTQVIFPWDHATVLLSGHYDGDVLLQVKQVRRKGKPTALDLFYVIE